MARGDPPAVPSAWLAALHVYPVKSCAGIGLESATLEETGLAHDREWMIVDEAGRFVTQRECPRLALIRVAFVADCLRLTLPDLDELDVPLALDAVSRRGPRVEVTVWRDRCAALDQGDAAARWLTTYLGAPHRLVRFDPESRRPSSRQFTGDALALNRFSDGYPLLAIAEASLADLNTRLTSPLPMDRFRPNLVLAGLPPYGEDALEEMVSDDGRLRLRPVKPCTRCVITTTDQSTGEVRGPEPLATLKGYRFSRELRGVLFGQNVIALAGAGEVLARGQRFALKWRNPG